MIQIQDKIFLSLSPMIIFHYTEYVNLNRNLSELQIINIQNFKNYYE